MPRKYGWKPQLPDARDWKYAFRPWLPTITPTYKNLHSLVYTCFDQELEGSCTANAICQLMMMQLAAAHKPRVILSRNFLYYNERVMEGDPGSDNGAVIRDGMKSAATTGVCLENLWPYFQGTMFLQPSTPAYQEAPQNLIKVYSAVPQDLNHMKICLAMGNPFVFGFTVFDSFESGAVSQSGNVPMPNLSTEGVVGGHAVVAIGYNDGKPQHFVDGKVWPTGTFLCQNSWGPSWGLTSMSGCFTVPYAYLEDSNLSSDFWMATLVL